MSYPQPSHGELSLYPLPALESNYIWAIVNDRTRQAAIVDPGEADVVLTWLRQQPTLELTAIIITHHHHDHTDGLAELITRFPALAVYGPNDVAGVTQPLHDGDTFTVLDQPARVLATPAHTIDHLCYLITPQEKSTKPILLTGDTLFMAGCGRLFEGTAEQMLRNMERFAALSPDTAVYAGHEYTLNNLAFALAVEPDNAAIQEAKARASAARAEGRATLPSTIGQERRTNPFMRTHEAIVIQAACRHAGRPAPDDPVHVLAALRHWKDTF
ncbi:hydroxyacylglutathione hydrolase [Zymobacter sp. IVIA_12111.31 C1]|uniref:hydroxyacylglutathione hydrolase n=1 Tax=Zymobacter sp. IVIA_12111.31 C1 TaxID=3394854 RepID=UPI0039C0A296